MRIIFIFLPWERNEPQESIAWRNNSTTRAHWRPDLSIPRLSICKKWPPPSLVGIGWGRRDADPLSVTTHGVCVASPSSVCFTSSPCGKLYRPIDMDYCIGYSHFDRLFRASSISSRHHRSYHEQTHQRCSSLHATKH